MNRFLLVRPAAGIIPFLEPPIDRLGGELVRALVGVGIVVIDRQLAGREAGIYR